MISWPALTHLVDAFDEHAPVGLRDRAAGLIGAVFVEALITRKWWTEDADMTFVFGQVKAMPVVGPDDIKDAGFQRPFLIGGQVSDLTDCRK